MAKAKHPVKRLLSSVARKRKINMNKGSPDYRIEAVLVSTVKKRRPQLPERRTSYSSSKAYHVPYVYVNGISCRSDTEEYSWGGNTGDWNLKPQQSDEDFMNLDTFFAEIRSHSTVDRY